MADKLDKWSDNVRGKFFVDEQCIDCDLCRETAPDFLHVMTMVVSLMSIINRRQKSKLLNVGKHLKGVRLKPLAIMVMRKFNLGNEYF